MRLQTRLTLLVLLASWGLLAAAVWLQSREVQETFAASFEAQREALTRGVGQRFAAVAIQVDDALAKIAADKLLEEDLLQPLERKRFYNDHARERKVVVGAERLVVNSNIDTLRLVDLEANGRVIAMGHRRGIEPDDVTIVGIVADGDRSRLVRREQIENLETGATDAVWTLQAHRVIGDRVALVGGRVLDEGLLDELLVGAAGPGVAVLLEAANGERIAATYEGEAPAAVDGGWREVELPLLDDAGDPLARMRIHVSQAGYARLVRDLWQTAGLLAGGSALLALVIGIWGSRRLSRPLERLAEAAQRLALGDRDVSVPALSGRDEVARLTRAFNTMTRDLEEGEERLRQSERVAAWREIARRIAHEIKNPLFPIQMSIETLQTARDRKHELFDEIFDESTHTILEEVERMKRIVTEFSDFARMPRPVVAVVDLSEIAAYAVALQQAAAPDVELRVATDGPVTVWADDDQMRQVMLNLVQNATDALSEGPDGGDGPALVEIAIEALPSGGAEIRVRDNGPGMDEETQGKLFTPYFTTKSSGTGLGLAVVHRIVGEHGGRVTVDSELGIGTEFRIRLPQGEAPAGAEPLDESARAVV